MQGWFITLAVFIGLMIFGFFIHKREEHMCGFEISIDDMETSGSIVFLLGVVGTIVSCVVLALCLV